MAITICVMLWARAGCEQPLADYEDQVLASLGRHQGRVLSRMRVLDDGPCEIQILEFASEGALAEFQNDPERLALAGLRDEAVERTQIIRVEQLQAAA